MKAPTTAPRKLSRPPTSAAINPARPMLTLAVPRKARPPYKTPDSVAASTAMIHASDSTKLTFTPRWLASSGFSAVPRN